jgi:hypothetical protein
MGNVEREMGNVDAGWVAKEHKKCRMGERRKGVKRHQKG